MPKKKEADEKKPRRANGEGTYKVRKDGRVEYQVNIGDDRKSFYGKSKPEARAAYTKYLKKNPIPLEKVRTLEDWAQNWLKIYKLGKVSEGTYYEYELIINNTIAPLIGSVKLPELRPAHIELLMRSVDKVSSSRQKKVCFLIKAILQSALENHYVAENVAINVTPQKAVKKEIEIFRRSEIQKLLTFEHPFAPVVKLMFMTGMRRGELLALSWRNVDMETRVIHVKQALSDGEIKDKTKGKKDRIIPISDELKEALDNMPRSDCFNVLSVDGRPMSKDQFNHRFKKFVEAAGVEYRSAHKCRHTFITYMLNSGVNIHVVKELAGHVEMSTTEQYTHVNLEDLKDNITKLKF